MAAGERIAQPFANANSGSIPHTDSNANTHAYAQAEPHSNANSHAQWRWRRLCGPMDFHCAVLRGRRGQCWKQQLHRPILQPGREPDHCGQ